LISQAFSRLPVVSSNRWTSDGSGFNRILSPGLNWVALAEHGDDLLAAKLGEHLRFRAGRLDHDDLGFRAVVRDGEMLGPDAVYSGLPSEAGAPMPAAA